MTASAIPGLNGGAETSAWTGSIDCGEGIVEWSENASESGANLTSKPAHVHPGLISDAASIAPHEPHPISITSEPGGTSREQASRSVSVVTSEPPLGQHSLFRMGETIAGNSYL